MQRQLLVNTKGTLDKTETVIELVNKEMPNEKQTTGVLGKLKTLKLTLQRVSQRCSPEFDGSAAYVCILDEVKDNLRDLEYYVNDFVKTNFLRKKTKGSDIRKKMTMI